ncbi:MAG: hypothetical protein ACQESN_02425 [Thermotogota bacterium]
MKKKILVMILFIFLSIISLSVEKIGFVYNGPIENYLDIFSVVYKYADITIPPSGENETLEVNYKRGNYELKYKNNTIQTSIVDLDSALKKLLNTNSRSIFVISDNSNVITEDSTRTSAFFSWNSEINIKLEKDGIVYSYTFNPPFGKRIVHIPSNFIDVNIKGEQEFVFLNDEKIKLPSEMSIPPTKFEIYDGVETYRYDLTSYASSSFNINLQKQNIFNKVETKLYKAYEIKSGVFLYGEPFSIWFPNEGDPVVTKSRFFSNYGDIEKINDRYSFKGSVAYVIEYNKTVYLISSAGELVSMGSKELYKDFGRSPMNVNIDDTSIQLNTFKMEQYTINFEGGIFKSGNVYSLFYNMPSYVPEEDYENNNYFLEIKDNIVNIYIK